jgi:hypothetical protein
MTENISDLGELCATYIARLPPDAWDLLAMLCCKGYGRVLEERRPDLSPEQRDAASSEFIIALADRMCALTCPSSRLN